jgi:hypothetical protein
VQGVWRVLAGVCSSAWWWEGVWGTGGQAQSTTSGMQSGVQLIRVRADRPAFVSDLLLATVPLLTLCAAGVVLQLRRMSPGGVAPMTAATRTLCQVRHVLGGVCVGGSGMCWVCSGWVGGWVGG